MKHLAIEEAITEWVIEYPHATKVFQAWNLDYCCAGKSLEYQCRQKGIDPHEVAAQILRLEAERNP